MVKVGKTAEFYKEKSSLMRKGETRNIDEHHKALGYPSETITHATAHAEGLFLKGKFEPCKGCALGKARQANVSKKFVPRSSNKGQQLFPDISSPSTKSKACKQDRLGVFFEFIAPMPQQNGRVEQKFALNGGKFTSSL